MRLADWDAATTAHVRSLWRFANDAHDTPQRKMDRAANNFFSAAEQVASERPIEERQRWAVLFALARLLSTQPVVGPAEQMLRDAIHAHCDALGTPLARPVWREMTRSRMDLVIPPPPPDGMREVWKAIAADVWLDKMQSGVYTSRLGPLLEKLNRENEPSVQTLAELWVDAVVMIQHEPANPVPVRLLHHFDGETNRAQAWRTFSIPKRRGGIRTITTPERSLKWLQRSVLQVLTHLFPRHRCAVGFERGKSVVTHASAHAGKRWVYAVDVQDFFPSITRSRVYGMLRAKPFEASEPVARILANLVTHDGALPQGAPTSPVLANLLCRRMDARLFKWARERGYTYTRYADDLAFSTNRAEFPEADRETIAEIIAGEGFTVHPEKRKFMPWHGRQLVTGLVVNRKANVPRETVRGLRALLFNVETFGWPSQVNRAPAFAEAEAWAVYKKRSMPVAEFRKTVAVQRTEKQLVRPGAAIRKAQQAGGLDAQVQMLQRVVRGRIEFVGAVKGKESPGYVRLREQYERLVAREHASTAEVKRGRASFVAEAVTVPAEAAGNYSAAKSLLRKLAEGQVERADVATWVSEKSTQSLEAKWLLNKWSSLDNVAGEVTKLAYELDTHPARTAAFFRLFGNGRPFRRLLHDPMVAPDAEGRFHFAGGDVQSVDEIVGACEKALEAPLPNRLKTEARAILKECRSWAEVHGHAHPYLSDELGETLRRFKWEVRFGNEAGLDLWDRLAPLAEELRAQGGVIEFEGDPPVFYTYTPAITGRVEAEDGRPATAGAVVRLLRSLVEKALEKAKQGGEPVSPVFVSAREESVGDVRQARIVLQATDGPVSVAAGLQHVLSGDTQDVLHEVRGLALWTMEVPYADGRVRVYDVTTNNEAVGWSEQTLPGFRHTLTFYL